jgi:hypothetical protein
VPGRKFLSLRPNHSVEALDLGLAPRKSAARQAWHTDSRWRRRGCAGSGSRRPFLFREIRCCDLAFLRRQGLRHPRHDLVVSISTLEVVQLLQKIAFRLTADDRNGCILADADTLSVCRRGEMTTTPKAICIRKKTSLAWVLAADFSATLSSFLVYAVPAIYA